MVYLLKIPYRSKPLAKLPIFWVANYLINEKGKVIQEWAELKEWTKFKWKEKYWEKFDKKVVKIREKIIWNTINDFLLWTNELNKINKYFKENLRTFLNHDKYTTWSNPTWSDYDFRKTPYLINWWKYNQLMFVNFFKELREENSTKIILELRELENYQNISLEKYFEIFPHFKEEFNIKNKSLQLILTSENENETVDIDINLKKDLKNDDYIKLILDKDYLINENKSEIEINKKRELILRRIFKNRMRKFEETDQIFWKLPESMCEWAHIYPVSKIKEKSINEWYMIADNNNWLNLPIQIHKMYDKHFIYFDNNWEIKYNNPEFEKQLWLIFCFKNGLKIKAKSFNKKLRYINMYNKLYNI